MAPQIQADARWVSVDAATRKAYVLSGKDRECALLSWIARGEEREASEEFTAAAKALGISDAWESPEPPDFLAHYRRLNLDYPFLDYSVETSHEADRALMDGYAANGAPPPVTTPRPGPVTELPDAPLPSGPRTVPDVGLLASWLAAAGRITGRRQGRHGPIVLKTSPSGGARHPTDLGVVIGAGWPDRLRGSWWYDGDRHTLIRAEAGFPVTASLPPTGVAFVVSSHVERAMWRYRDVRAFRPVLIDAGHVLETLDLAVHATGWSTAWLSMPSFTGPDPVLGMLLATAQPDLVEGEFPPEPGSGPTVPDTEYRTNPLLSLVPRADGLYAQVHSERRGLARLTPEAVTALAYANPSTRGDRPSRPAEIREHSGASPAAVEELVSARALLPADEAMGLWARSRPWIESGWFPSLLVHAEAVAEARTVKHRATTSAAPAPPVPWSRLPAALASRRTHRAFSERPLGRESLDALLRMLATVRSEVRLSLLHSGHELETGTYRRTDGGWARVGPAPTPGEIQRAAIGQPWTAGISAVAWLIPRATEPGGVSWQSALVQCGRDAQRIALGLAADPSCGVFQSPALVEHLLEPLTGLGTAHDGAYLVGVGSARTAGPAGGAHGGDARGC
ncbi:hypothetical protein DEJ51_29255 [Streptomyces venezuelae]|uniref:Nitroreductase domain-containing protein n=1 Tax=Streptomyces venezuelae TaxID=54571 RepID=A0A5P2DWX7_STRVZ|nr:hypothetical protein [Streptomyces venezuelae]QES57751.1 hypothetical protein DEJ51_29255 [Streptomyces venezuelae]